MLGPQVAASVHKAGSSYGGMDSCAVSLDQRLPAYRTRACLTDLAILLRDSNG